MNGAVITEQDERRAAARWALCFVAVGAAHMVIALVLLQHRAEGPLQSSEPPALLLELAPRSAPVIEPIPPAPDPAPPPVAAEPPPLEPPSPVEPPAMPAPSELLPGTLAKPPPVPPAPRPRRAAVQPVRPEPHPPVQPAPAPAPPTPIPAVTPQAVAAATTSWQVRLQAHLARFKKYPPEAQMRHQEGTPVLRFTMTRDGRVLSYGLASSSGHELLDLEAVSLMQRAQPLPPLPPELSQATIQLAVPLRFQIR